MKVLFATSEAWPLIKTGGLGDVSYSLPHALQDEGIDVRIVMPAYRDVLQQFSSFQIIGWMTLFTAGQTRNVRILQVEHDDFTMPIWLVDSQEFLDRPGNPYIHPEGYDWPDNAERFVIFSQAVAKLGVDAIQTGWRPDVVHSNDWQSGMVSAFLDNEHDRPKRIFTIHNLLYGGHFSHDEFNRLQLPGQWWSSEGVEFYGSFSMLKAGIIYSDAITTVSPTYALEICTPAFGYGLDGVLSARRYKLKGILNGIDRDVWNPENDPLLKHHYTAQRRNPGKKHNKQDLLESYGLQVDDQLLEAPLLGMVSRLVEQKGVDMVVDAIYALLNSSDANFVILGKGHAHFEWQMQQLHEQYPDRVFTTIGYSEEKAHLVEAGCDMFLMPSRFEPCGLNQMYSLRYGTLPIVHRTGGLADTVVDAYFDEQGKLNLGATGFVFHNAISADLISTIQRALDLYSNKTLWHQLQRNAMNQDFGWDKSAKEYIRLYNGDM